jgi:hypothetical protein
MEPKRMALLAVLALGGCVPRSMQGPTTATPAPERKLYSIPCADAHRYAATALKTNQYRIIEVERGPAGGFVKGKRPGGESMTIRIACGPDGVAVSPTGGGQWADQGMWFSFNQVVEFGERIWPPPKGPIVKAEAVRGPEAKLYFPREVEPLGLSAVRIRIVNGGSRRLRFEPRRTVAFAEGGGRAGALSADGVKQRLGSDPEVEAQLLKPVELAQGEEARGFVFFPAGDYRRIVLQLVDDLTNEPDEFEVFLGE